jgi:hypothetical protein
VDPKNNAYFLTQLSPALLTCLSSLLDLYGIVDYQVHKFIETLQAHSLARDHFLELETTDSDFALDSDRQLLVQPDLDSRVLLQELEDKVDGGEKDFAPTASAASIHGAVAWG